MRISDSIDHRWTTKNTNGGKYQHESFNTNAYMVCFFGSVIWLGIILTGFSDVHWALYIPAAGMTFAAITGICPSQIGVNMLFRSKTSGMTEVKLPPD